MSFLLALDIGRRRTGVALADTKADFVMALDTLNHATDEDLVADVSRMVIDRRVSEIAVGLPLLPQGDEGEQARHCRLIGELISTKTKIPVQYVDERYSTTGKQGGDPDARAACEIASVALQMRKN